MLTYLRIPSWIFLELKGQPRTFVVLLALIGERNTRTNNTRIISALDIAEMSGMSTREVYRCFQRLVNLDLIEKLPSARGKFMFYLKCIDIKETDEAEDRLDEKLISDIEDLLEENDGYTEVPKGVLRRECSTESTS